MRWSEFAILRTELMWAKDKPPSPPVTFVPILEELHLPPLCYSVTLDERGSLWNVLQARIPSIAVQQSAFLGC